MQRPLCGQSPSKGQWWRRNVCAPLLTRPVDLDTNATSQVSCVGANNRNYVSRKLWNTMDYGPQTGSAHQFMWNPTRTPLIQQTPNGIFSLEQKVLRAYVLSVLMYGSECWTISKEREKRLLAIEMWFLRRIFRISWTEKKTNEEVLHLHGTDRSLLQMIRKRQMEFLGHRNRHDGLEKLMLHGKVERKRARGRQRQTFMDSLSRFINTWNKNLSKLEISRRTEDREAWKSLIVDVCARPDT
ncbi:hypothetical protein EGW08_013770 [Elysia chlorotica]|uniref:Reverse transcriptase domain-containing protein n=1 Tax=Elysia chlorotica TaxID=188477 RepID=A0A433TA55_ELYCH|nr:hypothetical protein EGW08_013770 [Elysia chlorotica]